MVFPVDYIFKENMKRDEIGDTTDLTTWQIDSALMANSIFLKDISDSIFLETFINSMIVEFEKLGFTIYTENYIDSFLFFQTPAYILNFAQLELEEHYLEHEDSQEFGDYIYYKTIDLDAITFNSWLELSMLNNNKKGRKLFFASETIADIVDGYFSENIFTGGVKYKYQTIEVDVDIIYRYSEMLGRRYAGYTYDFLMNEYIVKNFPENKKLHYYMHFNRENNSLDMTNEERFILLEE